MGYFTWDASYSVQIARMDTEHQQLFHIINRLYDGMKSGRGKDVMQGVVQELLRYTQQHFSDEESLMRGAGYAELPLQVEQHKEFVRRVHGFAQDLKSGAVAVSVEVLDFLRDWLLNHIRIVDQRYSAFLNGKGIH